MRRSVMLAVFFAVAAAMARGQEPTASRRSGKEPPAQTTAAETPDLLKGKKAGEPLSEKQRASPGLTPEREAAAITFVRQHHVELVDLLLYLKVQRPKAYEQAVFDLFRVSERLAQQQVQNYDRYELDLALWKVESRIELLAARLKMAGPDSPEGQSLSPQLKKLLEQRLDLRLERLLFERERTAERLQRFDRQIDQARAHRGQNLDREFQRLTAQSPSASTGKRPAAKPPDEPSQAPR